MFLENFKQELARQETIRDQLGAVTGVITRGLKVTLELSCLTETEVALVRSLKCGHDYSPALDTLADAYLAALPTGELLRRLRDAVTARLKAEA